MRISRYEAWISALSLAFFLTMSLAASAQSTTTSPSQSAPAQSAPAQSAPAQSTAPNGQNSASQSSAQSNEDNPLNLTEDQKAKLRPIIMDENQQMEALRSDTTMTQDQKIAKANQIRSEASPKIKAILTPEQLQKLAELQRQRAGQQQQQGGQPTPPSNAPGSSPNNSQPPQK
ncbi:MAG TPA: hypothetical protein VFA85_17230 [Terriglobales bacterium]|nr:hypothetical protein [Terriglobales bacterium]